VRARGSRAGTVGRALGALGGVAAAVVAVVVVVHGPPPLPGQLSRPAVAVMAPVAPAPDLLADIATGSPDAGAERDWDAANDRAKTGRGGDARLTYFGPEWADVDRNGCRTDDDMRRRDLTDWTASGRCRVTGGVLPESYDGGPVDNAPRALQLDHVYALHLAYVMGAFRLSQDDRIRLANDPRNLILTNARANLSKGDDSLAQYLPPNPRLRCRYLLTYLDVARVYSLTMTADDKAAARRELAACGVTR
jgi:uncharacterized protein DUF1524